METPFSEHYGMFEGDICNLIRKLLRISAHGRVIRELLSARFSAAVFFPLFFLALLACKGQILVIRPREAMGMVLMFCAFMLKCITPRDGYEVNNRVLYAVAWLCSSPRIIVSLVWNSPTVLYT